MDDRDFDRFLKTRYVPSAPSNLAHRIVQASLKGDVVSSSVRKVGIGQWFSEFMEEFALPHPAVALGLFLLLGVGLGIWGQDVSLLPNLTADDLAMASEGEGCFETGDFL